MKHAKWAIALDLTLRLIAVHAISFADMSQLPVNSQMNIDSVPINFHDQIPQDWTAQELRYSTPVSVPQFQARLAPSSLAEVGASSSLAANLAGWSDAETELQSAARRFERTFVDQQPYHQGVQPISDRLGLASDRLASQQRLASIQLAEAEEAAKRVMHGWQQATQRTPPSLLALQQQQHARPARPDPDTDTEKTRKQPLALPQTVTQLWRQRNPAMAAALLEPVFYGYSLIVWILAMLFTGVSSASCFYVGNKFSGQRARNNQLPADTETGRSQSPMSEGSRRTNRLSSYFVYPGSPFNRPAPSDIQESRSQEKALRSNNVAEEDAEGVERWIKVPMQGSAGHCSNSQGYLDDDSDGGTERRPGNYKSPGYIDEY